MRALDSRPVDPAITVLSRAAEIIAERGWCQRQMYSGDGRCCVVGALAAAAQGVPVDEHLLATERTTYRYSLEFRAASRLRQRIGTGDLVSWNDDTMRTEEDVIRALRSATE